MNPAGAATNPALGVLIFALGGLAGAVFYLPFKKVANWAWESYWAVYAVAGLVIVPWALAFSTSPNVCKVLGAAPSGEFWYCYACGAMWGVGGLTWGLMIRYLGVGLGLALGCGICSAAGTLIPKMLKGEFGQLFEPGAGIASFAGVLVSLAGIVMVGMAGMSKEKELPEEEKKKAVAEYDFKKGILAACFSGLMSSGMGWGLVGGPTMQKLAETTAPVTTTTWSGMPVLVVVLLGGFTVNFLWCLFLNVKNKTTGDYLKSGAPLAGNFLFAAIAGAIWCSQFICFKTGEPAMGKTAYVGWALLMASAIMFSTLIGIFMGEWKGTSSLTRGLLGIGLGVLLFSTVIAGYSGKLSTEGAATGFEGVLLILLPAAVVMLLLILPMMCLFLSDCLRRVPQEFRKMEPGMVWLLLIPGFNLIWNFFVFPRLSESYQAYFSSLGRKDVGNCGKDLGMAYAICGIVSVIPFLGCLTGFASLLLLIIYLMKANGLRSQIRAA